MRGFIRSCVISLFFLRVFVSCIVLLVEFRVGVEIPLCVSACRFAYLFSVFSLICAWACGCQVSGLWQSRNGKRSWHPMGLSCDEGCADCRRSFAPGVLRDIGSMKERTPMSTQLLPIVLRRRRNCSSTVVGVWTPSPDGGFLLTCSWRGNSRERNVAVRSLIEWHELSSTASWRQRRCGLGAGTVPQRKSCATQASEVHLRFAVGMQRASVGSVGAKRIKSITLSITGL